MSLFFMLNFVIYDTDVVQTTSKDQIHKLNDRTFGEI